MNYRKYIFVIIGLLIYNLAFPQNKEKPSWLGVKGKPISNIYDYYIGIGENSSEFKAREQAVVDVKIQISDEIKAEYKVKSFSKTDFKDLQKGNTFELTKNFEFVATIEQTGEIIKIKGIKEVETYRENSYYYILYRKPKNGYENPQQGLFTFDKGSIWRSIIYSGWGQMYENKKRKGLALLTVQTLSISGIIVGHLSYSANIDKANTTMNLDNHQIYLDNAQSWETIRNVSGILLGAIYILNIIDITTSPKPKIYSNLNKIELQPIFYANTFQFSFKMNF